MKSLSLSLVLLPFLVLFSAQLAAESILIPGHIPSSNKLELPQRGATMDHIRDKFGNPNRERFPVGNPPITQWEYDGFNVFFEHQQVIHAIDLETLIMPE